MTRRGVASGRIQNIDMTFGPVRRWDIHVMHPTAGTRLGFRFVQPLTERQALAGHPIDVDRYILDRIFRDIARHITDGRDETPPLWATAAPLPAEPTQPGMTTHGHPHAPRHAPPTGGLGYPNDWDDPCPVCGRPFPALYGPHPTWVACAPDPVLTPSPTPSPSRPTHRHSTPSTPSPPLRGTGSNRDGVDRPRPLDGVKRTGSP